MARRRGRRSGGGDLRPDGRHREPRGRRPLAREGREGRRRDLRLRGGRDRLQAAPGAGGGRGHRRRHDHLRGSGAGLRPVDLRARPAGGRLRVALSGRARVGAHPGTVLRREQPAGDARPGRALLHPHVPGAVPVRRLRAEGEAEGPARHRDRRLRRVRGGLGSLHAGADRAPGAAAGPGQQREVHVLPARSRELHARRELPPGRVPRGAGAVGRGGVQLAGDHLRSGGREGARGVDRRGPSHDGSHRRRHRSHRPVGERPAVAARQDA